MVIWFGCNILKHSFIIWLAVRNQLQTHEHINKWCSNIPTICVMCTNRVETIKQLFFECSSRQAASETYSNEKQVPT